MKKMTARAFRKQLGSRKTRKQIRHGTGGYAEHPYRHMRQALRDQISKEKSLTMRAPVAESDPL